jgi:hypothetical protein
MNEGKTNQVPDKQAGEWLDAFRKFSGHLKIRVNPMFMERKTWEILSGAGHDLRIRIYFGLESGPSGKPVQCAYAVATVPDIQGVHRDQLGKIFRLDPVNRDFSAETTLVKSQIQDWSIWRNNNNPDEPGKNKFPRAFLLHASDLSTLFLKNNRSKVKLDFGLESDVNMLMYADTADLKAAVQSEYFDFSSPCPPYCDPGSPFNES